ncbi:hypothetical protein BsWGS_04623 [Bradybaena similaris]
MYGTYGILVDFSKVDGEIPYLSSSFVLSTEILKLSVCCLVLIPDFKAEKLPTVTFSNSLPFALPAVCYCINNNLAVFMQTQMDPSTYMVLGNMKIVCTAVLYKIIMKKSVSVSQWIALILLTFGGIINSMKALEAKTLSLSEIHLTWLGLCTLCIYCFISGFAGVFTEYILKKNYQLSLFYQNALLYTFGVHFNFLSWIVQALDKYRTHNTSSHFNIFYGYSIFTWVLIITQAVTGMTMSLIMKQSSNVMRLFVIATAPLCTTVFSLYLFNLKIHIEFLVSLCCVILAAMLYNHKGKKYEPGGDEQKA